MQDHASQKPSVVSPATGGWRAPGARPPRVAFITDVLGNSYNDSIFDEVSRVAHERGVEVICLVGGLFECPPTRNYVSDLADPRYVDAVFVVSLGNTVTVDAIVQYCMRFRPLPICTTTVPWSAFPSLLVDNEPGMRAGVRHLVEVHGRRRIAFVRGPEVSSEAELRFRVYREVLAEHGIPFDPALVSQPGWFTVQDGVEAMRLLLDERKVTFDAVACVNDGGAMGVMDALKARGIQIPRQVAVLGFDDIDVSPYLDSPLTTVRQPIREQAREAFRSLLAQMEGASDFVSRTLPAELVVRESCGCTAASFDAADARVSASVVRDLREALRADVADSATGGRRFTSTLRAALDSEARREGDVGAYQRVITVLERETLDDPGLDDRERRRADALLHEARVRISNASERTPAMQQMRIEGLSHRLRQSNTALLSTRDLRTLSQAAAEQLPELGISSVYVCLYEDRALPAQQVRLVLAWAAGRHLDLPREGLLFPSGQMLPEGMLPAARAGCYVVYVLSRDDMHIGYVVCERGVPEGLVYDAVRLQFDGSLGRFGLVEQLVEQSRRREAAERQRLESEIRVARGIQSGIEPRALALPGLELAASLVPAQALTGDYYDVVATPAGGWISLGGVAERGLSAGLIMLLLQSVVSGLIRSEPTAAPGDLLPVVRDVLSSAAIHGARTDRQATLSLLRYGADGRLRIAGAHAWLLLCRAGSAAVECIAAPSASALEPGPEAVCDLRPGDVFALCSRGLLLAEDAHGSPFGLERVVDVVSRLRDWPARALCRGVIDEVTARTPARTRDITLLVARVGQLAGATEPEGARP